MTTIDFTQPLPPTRGGLSTWYLGTIAGQEPFHHLTLHGKQMIMGSVDDEGISSDPDREFDLAVMGVGVERGGEGGR